MKKLALLLLTVTIVFAIAHAKIRRVGFFGSPVSGTDYISFATAYTAALAGDTILMFPSTSVNGTITKKLTLIGPGNWLDPNSTPNGNANLQAFAGIATIGSLTFDAGSDGSVLSGFYGGNIYVKDDNISILRNREIDVYITAINPAGTPTTIVMMPVAAIRSQQPVRHLS